MIMLQDKDISPSAPCPYIEGNECRYEHFFAYELTPNELEELLALGWRKFGFYYFRPSCKCSECIPLRICVKDFVPSKSQRRIMRKNSDIRFRIAPLEYREEIFEIYQDHSKERFGRDESRETFIEHFYMPSCPAAQSEFYCGDRLVGVGFLDISSVGISSVYFIYRKEMLDRSFGIFSMMAEIECARALGKDFYYPGFYVKGNSHMAYKISLKPHERFDLKKGAWKIWTDAK